MNGLLIMVGGDFSQIHPRVIQSLTHLICGCGSRSTDVKITLIFMIFIIPRCSCSGNFMATYISKVDQPSTSSTKLDAWQQLRQWNYIGNQSLQVRTATLRLDRVPVNEII